MLADEECPFLLQILLRPLDLLTSTGRLVRPVVTPNLPRQGWIPLHAPGEVPVSADSPMPGLYVPGRISNQ
jgi:hypothetical protein